MPLTQQELECYIWEQPAACEARGLAIHQAFFTCCLRYNRLSLGAYGRAPLVSVRFWPETNCYYAQVIVPTTVTLTGGLYYRGKRYLAGLKTLIERTMQESSITATVMPSLVLVCRQVQHPLNTEDLLLILNLDQECQVFTYQHGLDGLRFRNIGKQWHLFGPNGVGRQLTRLPNDIRAEYHDSLYWQQVRRAQELATAKAEPGEVSNLVITPAGVVARQDFAEEGLADE